MIVTIMNDNTQTPVEAPEEDTPNEASEGAQTETPSEE